MSNINNLQNTDIVRLRKSQNKKPSNTRRSAKVRDWQTQPTAVIVPPPFSRAYRNIDRTIDFAGVTSTSTTAGLYGFSFKLSDVGDYTAFTSSFDQYMIQEIDFSVRAVTIPATPTSVPAYSLCSFAVDFDSSAVPTAYTDILQYANCITLTTGESYSVRFVPHISMDADIAGVSTSAVSRGKQWIDLLEPDVTHYGVRLSVKPSTSTNVSAWYVTARYHIALRSSR